MRTTLQIKTDEPLIVARVLSAMSAKIVHAQSTITPKAVQVLTDPNTSERVGFMRVAADDEPDALVAALKACHYELLTLAPRLSEPYRKNAQACVDMAKAAMEEAGIK